MAGNRPYRSQSQASSAPCGMRAEGKQGFRIDEKLRSPVKIKLEGCPEAKITEYWKNGSQHKIPLPLSTQDFGKDCPIPCQN
jgi:hypothetical protein